MRLGAWLAATATSVWVVAACTSVEIEMCTAGPQVVCACPGGGEGARVCKTDGSGYGACNCSPSSSSSSGGDTCVPGAQLPCYAGPPGTEGVGTCKAGVRTCNPDGTSYGACVGEVLPQPEDCSTPADEDCDGTPGPCDGGTQWSKSFGDTGDDEVYGLAVDAQDRFAITGSFHGTVDFGGGPLSGGPTQAIFVAMYDPAGQHLWSKAFPGAVGAYGRGVGFTPKGDLVVAASCDADVDFGGGPLLGPTNGICLVSFDAAGGHLWSKRSNGGGPTGLAVDAAGNILLGGILTGDLGGGAVMGTFIAKLDPGAHFLWARQQVGYVEHIATDGAGDVFVHVDGGTDLAFGGPQNLGSGTAAVKLSGATGAFLYGSVATAPIMKAEAVAVDAQGNAFAAGLFGSSASFGGTTLTSPNPNTGYLVKVDPGGALLFAEAFGSAGGWAEHRAGAATPSGDAILAGMMAGTVDFGSGPVSGAGLYVAKLDPTGTGRWAHVYANGDTNGNLHPLVAVDHQGGVILVGSFSGQLDLGKGVLASSAPGDQDVFIARLSP